MAVDLVFETDAQGRFTFVAPDPALGHRAHELLGKPAAQLLLDPSLDPFERFQQMREMRLWLHRGRGGECCVALCLAPLLDEAGRPVGLRGTARDVTAEERAALSAASALRRNAMLDRVMNTARAEKPIDQRMRRVLEGFRHGVGCMGLALLERQEAGRSGPMLVVGDIAPSLHPADALIAMATADNNEFVALGPHGGPMIFFDLGQGLEQRAGLIGWRAEGARAFDAEEIELLAQAADILRGMRSSAMDREALAREAGTDPLTGLFNRRAFITDLERRLARASRANAQGGALIYIDLDNFKPLNDQLGHAAGDAALKRIALLLREGVRPSDLVGRLGGDEFAAWLDNADIDAASARAEALHQMALRHIRPLGPADRPLSMSIGIAILSPGIPETTAGLLARADAAMYVAKRLGPGRWSAAAPREEA